MRSIISTTLVILLGSFILWIGTDEFRAFTAEGARIVDVEDHPRVVPSFTFEDALGQQFQLQDFKGKLLIITFIYTQCGDLCPAVERNLMQIYNSLPSEVLGQKIQLLSVSFDPKRDDLAALKAYGDHFGADHLGWRFAKLKDENNLNELLNTFEVTVIPNEFGGFEHNAAFCLVDRDGKLIKILDYQDPVKVLQVLRSMLNI